MNNRKYLVQSILENLISDLVKIVGFFIGKVKNYVKINFRALKR